MLINFTYYAQYYAHVKDLCLEIQYFAIKLLEYILGEEYMFLSIYFQNNNMVTVLLEYINLLVFIFSRVHNK